MCINFSKIKLKRFYRLKWALGVVFAEQPLLHLPLKKEHQLASGFSRIKPKPSHIKDACSIAN